MKKMRRVLQVLGSLQRGGAETLVMNIYRNIDRENIQFDFIVRENVDNGYEEEVKKMGGRIFVIPSPQKIGLKKCIKKHISIIRENGPYICVHSHMNAMSFISMYAAKKCNVKNRVSHSHSTSFPGKIKLFLGRYLTKKFSTKLLACSKDAGLKLFGKGNFEIIPNGIILENFLVSDEKEKKKYMKKLNLPVETTNIIHIGRFVEAKNHEFIIKIAKELNKKEFGFNLYLLGDGPKYNEIKDLVIKNELSNKIHLLGSVSNVNEYMKASDLMIMPSLYEGFPVTLVESQTAGLPSIISDNITKNVDFNINLIEFIPLEVNKWVNIIREKKYKRIFNKEKIYNTITKNDFNILNTVEIMKKIYSEE